MGWFFEGGFGIDTSNFALNGCPRVSTNDAQLNGGPRLSKVYFLTNFRRNFSLLSTLSSKNRNFRPVCINLRLDLTVLNSKTLVSQQQLSEKRYSYTYYCITQIRAENF